MINIKRRRSIRLAAAAMASLVTANRSMATTASTDSTGNNACKPLLSHQLRPLMGPESQSLCDRFSNQVLLLVNTASRCGFTPQFEGLEQLHQRYSERGFQVLGFPSADFRQELATEEEVSTFCEINYGVTFPMFEKISVTSDSAHPLYKDLAAATGTFPKWNFNKYLVNRDGEVIAHYNSGVRPLDRRLIDDIEALL